MKSKIEENNVLGVVKSVLLEEASRVNRNEFNKIQFKIEELESQLMETIKELRKLEDTIPDGLKTITNGRVRTMSSNLSNTHATLKQLRGKLKDYKKSLYQQSEDKK